MNVCVTKSSKLNYHAIICYKQAASFSNPATHSSLKEHTGKHFNLVFFTTIFVHSLFHKKAFSPLLFQWKWFTVCLRSEPAIMDKNVDEFEHPSVVKKSFFVDSQTPSPPVNVEICSMGTVTWLQH